MTIFWGFPKDATDGMWTLCFGLHPAGTCRWVSGVKGAMPERALEREVLFFCKLAVKQHQQPFLLQTLVILSHIF